MRNPYAGLRRGLLAAAVLFSVPASAQVASPYDAQPSSDALRGAFTNPVTSATSSAARRAKALRPGKDTPLGSTLQDLAADYEARVARGARARGEAVMIEAFAKGPRDVRSLERSLARLGFKQTNKTGIVISGRLPVSAISALAGIPSLRSAMAPHYVRRSSNGTDTYISPVMSTQSMVGAVTGEASVALRAETARETFGVDGTGVRIGMISDSYDNCGSREVQLGLSGCVTTAADDMASGDLPEDVLVLDDLDLVDPDGVVVFDGADEGRAMMQLAYDVAPGATFGFHTAFEGYASFAGGVVDLFQAGSQIVVDDIGTSVDPFFQDGAIAQAVDYIVSQGGLYFSSAGNAADASYESDYRASGVFNAFGQELHDFDPGPGVDVFQDIVVPPGGVLRFVFQYDEPSILAGVEVSEYPTLYGGAPGQSPTSDYDLVLLDAPDVNAGILDLSLQSNPLRGAPDEFIEYVNASNEAVTVYLTIELFGGVPRRMKYINFGGTRSVIQNAEYVEDGTSTTFGHSNAAGTFATGAAAWFDTDQFNASVAANPGLVGAAIVESFTSYGGLDILLDVDGNRLATPIERMKPDATASDGDNNTFFGQQLPPSLDPNPAPNFFGTSAAAPNASAVAALALEATGFSAGPAEIYGALESTAGDILGLPSQGFNVGSAPGFDDQTGFGLIRADAAIASLVDDDETIACSAAAPLFFADFDADGDDDTFGEFAAIGNDGSDDVDLSTCSFAVFNPFTERVTYTSPLDLFVASDSEITLATENGDIALPAGSLPDGPGAIVLLEGDVSEGATVQDVLGSIVASVVYVDDDNVFGSRRGGADATRTARTGDEAFLDALAEARTQAATGPVDLTLTASPNPVSGRLAVGFGVAEAAPVRASVYDALGREVAVLADRPFEGGRHEVALDTATMPSGVYVVRVIAGADVQTTQVTVVR